MISLLFAAWLTVTPAVAGDLSNPATATEVAPASYKVLFETTAGDFTIKVERAWSPNGADRFYNLAKLGFYDDTAFFRVLEGFMAQFGIHADPALSARWIAARIKDDPVLESNKKGMVSFAMAGPDTRTTQVFINTAKNSSLDKHGFSPFGKVISGYSTVKALFQQYGEGAPRGTGPNQMRIQTEGNQYLKANYPRLDYVIRATVVE
ncbi:MAG: peptidylprolyl isomerase [Rhodobacterales bacterium]|nr:peptidylprolyl isomerase [Rhodobacterales bacterium]